MPLATAFLIPPPSAAPLRGSDFSGFSGLDAIRALAKSTVSIRPIDAPRPRPIESLRRGDWIKLICGASFEDAMDIRNLSLVYALAGVDCIDCAADESVVNAVNGGIDAAVLISSIERPWVMISVNDDKEDLHFRKAAFDPEDCPLDCSRPCEKVCPANAILLENPLTGSHFSASSNTSGRLQGGVVEERCYGCGRCFPACPYDKIRAETYIRDSAATAELLKRNDVDAIEIHTTGRCIDLFNELWDSLGNSIKHVKLVALDGRPMTGDIGRGATREAINFAIRLAAISDRPHGFYQLAGGTNLHTVESLKKVGLFQATKLSELPYENTNVVGSVDCGEALIGGIAYGGYARKIVGRVLRKLPSQTCRVLIENHPEYLLEALTEALALVGPVKSYNLPLVCPQL